jgi:hypothetical protein
VNAVKLQFNDKFLDLKGYPLPYKLCDTLAEALAKSSAGSPYKQMKWAHNLVNYGEINVSAADVRFLKQFILNNSRLTNLAKYQLLQRLPDESKEGRKIWNVRSLSR